MPVFLQEATLRWQAAGEPPLDTQIFACCEQVRACAGPPNTTPNAEIVIMQPRMAVSPCTQG
jgi:hypothetical protein